MKTRKLLVFLIIVSMLATIITGCSSPKATDTTAASSKPAETAAETTKAAEIKRISLATGGTSGTYYPIGAGITAVISKYADGIEATAESTGASVANSKMLRDEQIELIMVSASTALSAFNGNDAFAGEPAPNMRGIASLYPEIFQFVALEESGLQKVMDLKGKKVAVGAPGSGTERIAKILLEAHGITYDDIDPQFLGFGEAVTALKDRLIDCIVVGSGLPTSAVVDASASLNINLLEVDKKAVEATIEKYVFLGLVTIPEGTYNGVNKDVLSVGTPALLVTSEKMDDETIYKITKSIFEHLDEIERVHAQGSNIKLETALNAMSVPLHPGAEKYYKEVGLIK